VDLVSQAVLSLADRYMNKHSPEYPVGRSRLEALSVIACAFIMSMASIEVIQFSCYDLYDGFNGDKPELNVDFNLYTILGVGIVMKFLLWLFCLKINQVIDSDMIGALAEDHFNDVISNTVAIATAAAAVHTSAWWVDPVGAIVISLVIIFRWVGIINEQVKKIVGYTAPPEFIEQVNSNLVF
jgi:divalent metal cation (Fe/Co/Zn/Cd) transporter